MNRRTARHHDRMFCLALIAAPFLCVTPTAAEELASHAVGPRALFAAPSLSHVAANDQNRPAPVGQAEMASLEIASNVSLTDVGARADTQNTIQIERPVPSLDLKAYDRRRPPVLIPLYVSLATFNLLDAHSTFRAVDAGARELNPLVVGFANNRGALLAVKAGVTMGTVFLSERMWRGGKRKSAVAMIAALTVANALIARHNYRVASSMR
jgi:hypothetical protein